MLRIFLALWLAFTPVLSWAGSMSLLGVGTPPAAAGGCSDTNATAWKNAVVTAGGTVSTGQQTNVCNLIVALKGHGLFAKLDRLWLLASENATQANIDIVNLGTWTASGTITFAANAGYTGDGSTGHLDTNFDPATAGGHYSLNSASMGVFTPTNRTTGADMVDIGSFGATTGNQSFQKNLNPSNNSVIALNDNNTSSVAGTVTAKGSWINSRVSSTAESIYQNGSLLFSFSSSTVSGLTDSDLWISALNFDGHSNVWNSTDQNAIVFIGGGMSSTDATNFDADVNGGYLTAIGSPVH